MSKSIYEEANLILNGRIADGEVKSFRVRGTTYYKITNALKQAQKQEKLLELYKQITLLWEHRYEYTNSVGEREKLWKIVKELENDK